MSSTSTGSRPEPYSDESYPSSLLKYLLTQMMGQFAAQGACIALPDGNSGQMKIQMHLRLRSTSGATSPQPSLSLGTHMRHSAMHQENGATSPMLSARQHSASLFVDEVEEITPEQSALFAVDTPYTLGQDLIGYTWKKKELQILNHKTYLQRFHGGLPQPFLVDVVPTSYLAVPIEEPVHDIGTSGIKQLPTILGVIVLYQITSDISLGFHTRQCREAISYYKKQVALYLQNDKLQRSQRRTCEYLQLLQEISTTFPTTVNLPDLLEKMYNFVTQVVDVSSLLLTLYDRDTERIYDVFAVKNGKRMENLAEYPQASHAEERPVWWQITQKEMRTLQFSPAQEPQMASRYHELLTGAWNDQREAESFLLLPMKMFTRVVGSLCLTSMHASAYRPEEVQVLETMVQIVTVGLENVKLYKRDRQSLQESQQRGEELAAINSALQSISSVLNVSELLNNFLKSVETLVKVDICVFFQLSPNKEELVAQAMYGLSTASQQDDGSDMPAIAPLASRSQHDELVGMIRFPFKDTFLEQMVNEGFFFLDASQLEDLAQKCEEGGALFLHAALGKQMLMIPMCYQTELIGLLAVPTQKEETSFRPKEVGTLLALCAQATSAIRNAQLFEQREEAYAQVQHMNKLKDEFLVTASHELRTPLSAIVGYTSLLKRQSMRISAQQILRFATRIGSAAHHLLNLVENMTEAAQMGAVDKKLELTISPIQVYLAAEIASSMLLLSSEQTVTLHVDPQLWVLGDALRFRQVLSNLLDNAAKYSPPESQIILSASATTLSQIAHILPENQADHEVRLFEQGDLPIILIRVQDHGEGILPGDQQKIFEKFVRAQRSLTTPVRGSGLGLYICLRYVEAMGGKLWLERSVSGEGSIFSFYLPQTEAPIERGEQATSEYKAR
jgi:signal transduction histidine kinase